MGEWQIAQWDLKTASPAVGSAACADVTNALNDKPINIAPDLFRPSPIVIKLFLYFSHYHIERSSVHVKPR
jgi:hypothetical protein